jgi:hypothetical protein
MQCNAKQESINPRKPASTCNALQCMHACKKAIKQSSKQTNKAKAKQSKQKEPPIHKNQSNMVKQSVDRGSTPNESRTVHPN